jgi:uncharacterized protein (TIGR00725 family)
MRPDAPQPRLRRYIGVIGAGECDAEFGKLAEAVGRGIAEAGAVLVCGGMGGVMEAACRGAKVAGGLTIGILPGPERGGANGYVDIAIATGINEARNLAIIRTADALVAVGGSYGTLSEIGFALRMGKRVIGLKTWDISGIVPARTAEDAVRLATD